MRLARSDQLIVFARAHQIGLTWIERAWPGSFDKHCWPIGRAQQRQSDSYNAFSSVGLSVMRRAHCLQQNQARQREGEFDFSLTRAARLKGSCEMRGWHGCCLSITSANLVRMKESCQVAI